MFLFVIGLIGVIAGLIALFVGIKNKFFVPVIAGLVVAVLGGGALFASTFYSNGVGEAKVLVNSVSRGVNGTIESPGSSFKSPLDDFVEFDLFSQQLTFAGGGDGSTPSYTGGTVNGAEITVNVGGEGGGSTRANIDVAATYSLGTSNIVDIYEQFRSQELFTEQIITKQLLSVARQVPSEYSAIDFRGGSRGEAEAKIREQLNERLAEYGVEFTTLTIQDVRYSPEVETALTQIEQANQAAQTAEANQRTKQVEAETALIEAQGRAQAEIAQADGEAEANRRLAASLTPEVLEQRRIEALYKAAESGKLIVSGDSPLLQVPAQ